MFKKNKKITQIVERIKEKFDCSTDLDVAKVLGMTSPALSNHKIRGSIPYETLFTFCEKKYISFDWLLTGEGEMKKITNRGYETGEDNENNSDVVTTLNETQASHSTADARLNDLHKKIDRLYKLGNLQQRAMMRGMLEELNDQLEPVEEESKKKVA